MPIKVSEERLDVKVYLQRELDMLKGRVIDQHRVALQNDRQFGQAERSVKQYFRETFDGIISVLKEAYPEVNVGE